MIFKLFVSTILLAALLVFALQNTETVKVHILLWTFSLSSVLLILIPFLVGFLLGWGLNAWGRHRRKEKKATGTP
ncbi:MAG TPA: LapA family protein [bacterium]|nr:LapA family protein [bacterium]